MSFVTQYTIVAKDDFTATATKISKSFDAINARAKLFHSQMGKINASMMGYKKHFSFVTTEIKAMNSALAQTNAQMTALNRRKLTNPMGGIGGAGGGGTRKNGNFGRGSSLANGGAFASGIPMLGRQFIGGYLAYQGVKETLSTGMDFETEGQKFSALTGIIGDDLDKVKEKAVATSIALGLPVEQAMGAYTQIGNAMPELEGDINKIQAITDQALKLSRASGSGDVELEALSLGRFMHGFNAKASEAGAFAQMLSASSKYGSSEIKDTGEALKRVAPVGGVLGYTPQQALSMIEVGAPMRKGGTGGRQIAGIMSTMAKMNIDVRKTGLTGAFDVVAKVVGKGKTAMEQHGIAVKLFGKDFAPLAEYFLANRKELDRLIPKMDDKLALDQQVQTQMESSQAKLDVTKAKFEKLGLVLFDKVQPALDNFIDGLGIMADILSMTNLFPDKTKEELVDQAYIRNQLEVGKSVPRNSFGIAQLTSDEMNGVAKRLTEKEFGLKITVVDGHVTSVEPEKTNKGKNLTVTQ